MPATLGQVLKQARANSRMTLRDVEAETKIHNAHLSQIENGTITKPDLSMLWQLASLYGLDYRRLLKLAGYDEQGESSGRQRQRTATALRAMGELTPQEQSEVLSFMADLRNRRSK
jgi:HTH-type transcriptional regulator, competence development regulator